MTGQAHRCPASGCDALVPPAQYACRVDWFRLPLEIRRAINRGYRAGDRLAHRAAMQAAASWYREHPKPARSTKVEGSS